MSKLTATDLDVAGQAVFVDDEVERQILQIIKRADKQIIFVTPYVQLWVHLKEEIQDAMKRGVQTIFLIRADGNERNLEHLKWLQSNISKLHEIPNLHSKIYLNEKAVLVSSMNITAGSTRDSKDFAILIRRQDDVRVLRDYVTRLTAKSTTKQSPSMASAVSGLIKSTVTQSLQYGVRVAASRSGKCIRCGEKIPYDPARPYCATHYQSWVKWKNEDYAEKFCHSCGKPAKTSLRKPECDACYKLNHSS